eukprot:COSAG04_NODE_735_length_10705_cov_33.479823_14_plen_390_part_00
MPERRVTRAAAKAAAQEQSMEVLEKVLAEDRHEIVFGALPVVELWRLRRVCRAFHRWGTAALAALPRVAVVGGELVDREPTAGVEVLDLSTLRWSSGVVPALPQPRQDHSVCALEGSGRVVVAGGCRGGGGWGTILTVAQWVRGAAAWVPLPNLAEKRRNMPAVALPDGRAMLIGGRDHGHQDLASVEVLAADGSGWSALAPMGTARDGAAAALLPCGKVLVAGGYDDGIGDDDDDGYLTTAELWDPATGGWSDLPPMAEGRFAPACCVLSSGRVAVVGGYGSGGDGKRADGELFDPVARTWQPLPPMCHGRNLHGMVAVLGGMLAVGGGGNGGAPNELFDEASGRWFELPHPMAERRRSTQLVSLPAAALAALAAPAAAAGAAAAAAQ